MKSRHAWLLMCAPALAHAQTAAPTAVEQALPPVQVQGQAPGVGPVRIETYAVVDGKVTPQVRALLVSYRIEGK